ncbi:MAG: hypothetical protein WCP87_02615 [Atribacterota bacterium]
MVRRTEPGSQKGKIYGSRGKVIFLFSPIWSLIIDIWLTDGEIGMRYEDGILVTARGIRELSSYHREIIVL